MNKPSFFYHPDISPTVAARRAGEMLVDLLVLYGGLLTRQRCAYTWPFLFKSNPAYRSAVYRLHKAGVVTRRSHKGGPRTLRVSEGKMTDPALHPQKRWNAKWDGIWRVLVYDIPEKERTFRIGLCRYLHKLRLGCLQQSVWVTPRDIRPEYDDLLKALDIQYDSYLFDARTVLGRKAQDIVGDAWNFREIQRHQSWFVEKCSSQVRRIQSQALSQREIEQLAREEVFSYLSVMEKDPLLPRTLWPKGYRGESAYEHHLAFVTTVKECLSRL